jgi:DNA-binding NarL/FixJ family response regulator
LSSARELGIPTIVVSGVTAPDEIERAYEEHGVSAFLSKQTFGRPSFLHAVAQIRAAHDLGDLEGLTARELEVAELLARGMTNKEIADALVITTNTVKRHLKAIFAKLDVHTRAAAAAKAISAGIPLADG